MDESAEIIVWTCELVNVSSLAWIDIVRYQDCLSSRICRLLERKESPDGSLIPRNSDSQRRSISS
jgi:hypothetical protein